MDTDHSFSRSELNALWNRKNKRYTIKSFTENGHWITHLVLHDKCAGGTVIGKLVKRSSEEFRQRPWLHHRNLASLVDMVTIHDEFTVFISIYQKKSIREIIHDEPFVHNLNCFSLKKAYIKDVLWGLDYLHRNGLCLMNLTDANVFICEQKNKAIINDFGSLTQVNNEEECKFDVPFIHQPPEIRMVGEQCDLIAAEMFVTGMMVMEIFTQHQLPWALVDYDPDRAQEMLAKVDYEMLKVANAGSTLSIQDLREFKTFVGLFIDNNPQQRHMARDAASTMFLQSSKHGVSLQKSATSSINGSETNEGVSFPSVYQLARNFKHNCRSNDIHTLKTTRSHLDENKTKKSKSNLSFKKCVYSVKKTNSDIQSHDNQQPNYVDFDNDVVSESSNNVGKINSESKSILNIDSMPQGNISCFDDLKPLSNIKSKTSLSSQVELKHCTPEKPISMPANECSDKCRNEEIDFIPMNRSFVTYNYSPTIIKEKSVTTKMLPNATENNYKNIFESCKKILIENEIKDSPSKSDYLENTFEKVCVPCNIDLCTSSSNNYEACPQQTTSDKYYTYRMLPKDSTRNIITRYNRNGKFMIDVNNSLQKERIPVYPENYPETCCLNSKAEAEILCKNPYTLSKNSFSSFQISTANNASDLIAKTNHAIGNELKKEMNQNMFKQSGQIKGHNSSLVNNIKTQNMSISDFKHTNQPSANAAKFVLKKVPCEQTHLQNVSNCRFQHGYTCPKNQKNELLNKSIHQEANFFTDNKEYTSENKCTTCVNTNIEPKVPDKNYGNTFVFPKSCSLPHEYWFPERTHFEQRNSPILLPTGIKKTVFGTHQSPPIWKVEDLHKVKDTQEGHSKEEDRLQKVVLLRGPRVTGRNPFRVDPVPSGNVKKKNVERDALEKCKKSGKKFGNANASTECIFSEDSSDKRKSSKKKKSHKKCFCIGK